MRPSTLLIWVINLHNLFENNLATANKLKNAPHNSTSSYIGPIGIPVQESKEIHLKGFHYSTVCNSKKPPYKSFKHSSLEDRATY